MTTILRVNILTGALCLLGAFALGAVAVGLLTRADHDESALGISKRVGQGAASEAAIRKAACADPSRFDLVRAKDEYRAWVTEAYGDGLRILGNDGYNRSQDVVNAAVGYFRSDDAISIAASFWFISAITAEHHGKAVPDPSAVYRRGLAAMGADAPDVAEDMKGIHTVWGEGYLRFTSFSPMGAYFASEMLEWDEGSCAAILLDAQANSALLYEVIEGLWRGQFVAETSVDLGRKAITATWAQRMRAVRRCQGGFADTWARYMRLQQSGAGLRWITYLSQTDIWPMKAFAQRNETGSVSCLSAGAHSAPTVTSQPTRIPTAAATTPRPVPDLTIDQLRNAEYQLPNELAEPEWRDTVLLRQGVSDEFNYETAAFGDLDGDGLSDAVVLIRKTQGNIFSWVYAIGMLNRAGKPLQSGTKVLSGNIAVQSVAIEQGQVTLLFTTPRVDGQERRESITFRLDPQ